ncbi:hypothetical protein OSB04_013811 [Centaurea solstitialis]|uniref:Dirigent protein n=1 Tax=Centaurea solstitialis TaxID=347529 RepID=A0AA38TX06_9ASTR|nr:hypothetical protein OSB04_013811 [Centaurea solstitialis]
MAGVLLKHKFTILSFFLFIFLVEGKFHKFSRQLSPKSYGSKKEKLTNLMFCLHERASGNHPTVMQVAKGAKTDTSSSKFGLTVVKDELLTLGPEPTSKIVGRAQGIGSYVDLQKPALMMVYNYVFVEGKYNESTLNVVGRNPILSKSKEFQSLAGPGYF